MPLGPLSLRPGLRFMRLFHSSMQQQLPAFELPSCPLATTSRPPSPWSSSTASATARAQTMWAPQRFTQQLTERPRHSGGRHFSKHAPPPRLRVAVDIDEVLGRFLYCLNQYYLERYQVKYDVKDYFVYEFYRIWGCSRERSNEIVHDFFKSQQFIDGIPIVPGAAGALSRLSSTCDLVVVTSRQHAIQDRTLEWIDRHYPGLFQEVYFGNHWALEGSARTKSEICRSIGASVLIDDNPGYATECAEAGMQVLLYDWEHEHHPAGYPWSKIPSEKMHPRITVVRNWVEVESAVSEMVVKLSPQHTVKAQQQQQQQRQQ